MTRGYVVHGECMVSVRFGQHVSGAPFTHAVVAPTAVLTPAFTLVAAWNGLGVLGQIQVANQLKVFGYDTAGLFAAMDQGTAALGSYASAQPGLYESLSQTLGFPVAYTPGQYSNLSELGLAVDQITISPHFYHQGVIVDDWGPDSPAEVLVNVSEVRIHMDLIHWDPAVFEMCVVESMGGGYSPANAAAGPFYPGPGAPSGYVGVPALPYPPNSGTAYGLPGGGLGGSVLGLTPSFLAAGGLAPGGMPLGRGVPAGASGCHYVSLNLSSPRLGLPLRFPTCYLAEEPYTLPLGTEASILSLHWRAIAYAPAVNIAQNDFGAFLKNGNAYTPLVPTTVSGVQSYPGSPGGVPILFDRTPDV